MRKKPLFKKQKELYKIIVEFHVLDDDGKCC